MVLFNMANYIRRFFDSYVVFRVPKYGIVSEMVKPQAPIIVLVLCKINFYDVIGHSLWKLFVNVKSVPSEVSTTC